MVRTLKHFFEYCEMPEERLKQIFTLRYIYTPDEVYVLMLKYLQGVPGKEEGRTQEDIAEYFSTTDTTTQRYSKILQDGVDILGEHVEVEFMRRTNESKSSVHPIFLPLNLVEVVTMLSALMAYDEDDVRARVLNRIADDVYAQLSPYAKEKLEKLHLDEKRFNSTKRSYRFVDRENQDERVLFAAKEQVPCKVKYYDDQDELRECVGLVSWSYDAPQTISVFTRDLRHIEISYRRLADIEEADENQIPS